MLVSTDILGCGSADASASFSNNVIAHFGTGVYVEEMCELFGSDFPDDCNSPGDAAPTFRSNVILGNAIGANGLTGTGVDARENWWGCSKGANANGCDSTSGTVDFIPWLTKPPKP